MISGSSGGEASSRPKVKVGYPVNESTIPPTSQCKTGTKCYSTRFEVRYWDVLRTIYFMLMRGNINFV